MGADKNKAYGWRDVLSFFKQFRRGKKVTRKQYFEWFGEDPSSKSNLADSYRCYLTRAGYLQIVAPGVYKIIRRASSELTARQCRREAYPKKKRA